MEIPDTLEFNQFRCTEFPCAVKKLTHGTGGCERAHNTLRKRVDGNIPPAVQKAVVTVPDQVSLRPVEM